MILYLLLDFKFSILLQNDSQMILIIKSLKMNANAFKCIQSSLIRAIARVDDEHDGEVWRKEGLVVGYLEQEPTLDANKSVLENITDGLGERKWLLERFEAVSMEMGEPDADFEKLLEEQAELQGRIEELGCWNIQVCMLHVCEDERMLNVCQM